jgi:hypothetical protein
VRRDRVGLALLAELLVREQRRDHDVGGDPVVLRREAAGPEEELCRDLERAVAVRQRRNRLHGPLPEAVVVADDHRAAVVLQRARDDLRGRGAPVVHQHDHRQGRVRLLGVRGEAHVLVADPPLRVDHQLAVLDELLGHLDRGREEPARVVPEVEDQGLHALLAQLLQGDLEVVAGLLLELPEADVADAVAEVVDPYRVDADLLARDVEVPGLGPALRRSPPASPQAPPASLPGSRRNGGRVRIPRARYHYRG